MSSFEASFRFGGRNNLWHLFNMEFLSPNSMEGNEKLFHGQISLSGTIFSNNLLDGFNNKCFWKCKSLKYLGIVAIMFKIFVNYFSRSTVSVNFFRYFGVVANMSQCGVSVHFTSFHLQCCVNAVWWAP